MHSVLFVVKTTPKTTQDWDAFVSNLEAKLKPRTDGQSHTESLAKLGENVWLLNLEKSTAPLGWLIGFADRFGFEYGMLPFDKEPQWLPSTFKL